jgi:hypothetical protein
MLLTLWPGDSAWNADGHGDDQKLITMAIDANAHHHLVTSGLGGSFGYPYGPIPAQIYQLLAIFSHDPITLVRLHAALFAGVTSIGLLWLATVLGLSPWFAPMTMLGPFFWFYSRLLWDNTFAIPIGTVMLAAYGAFLNRPNWLAFFLFMTGVMLLPFVHPMTLPLVLAVAAHGIIRDWRKFVRYWFGLIVPVVLIAVSCGQYILRVAGQIGSSPALTESAPDHLSRFGAFAFPLFAGRLFCAHLFFDARGPELGLEQNPIVVAARCTSLLAYGFIWLGLIVAISQLGKKIALPVICLLALLLQSMLDGRLMISPYPHYYCGTWPAIVVMMWLGLDQLQKFKLRLPIGLIYAASLIIATGAFVLDIHHNHGGTIWYGPSMASQLSRCHL